MIRHRPETGRETLHPRVQTHPPTPDPAADRRGPAYLHAACYRRQHRGSEDQLVLLQIQSADANGRYSDPAAPTQWSCWRCHGQDGPDSPATCLAAYVDVGDSHATCAAQGRRVHPALVLE